MTAFPYPPDHFIYPIEVVSPRAHALDEDPEVQESMRVLQQRLGVTETGVYDPVTHDAARLALGSAWTGVLDSAGWDSIVNPPEPEPEPEPKQKRTRRKS